MIARDDDPHLSHRLRRPVFEEGKFSPSRCYRQTLRQCLIIAGPDAMADHTAPAEMEPILADRAKARPTPSVAPAITAHAP